MSYVLFGSLILFPIVSKAPLLGWDWYYFYNANNPVFNLYTSQSAYPPFTHYFIELFTGMDWRVSLGWLNSITLFTVALATWKNGGKYKEIALALSAPPLWFLMWVGHPEGLVLLGVITGIVPLILIKPVISLFSIFSSRKLFAWTALFFVISLIIWPGWIFAFQSASFGHEAAFGWADMGWPLLILGCILLPGAGKNSYRLMAAGCFITPFLMPYHLALLTPAMGKARGWRLVLLWLSSWCVFLGTGLQGYGHLVSFAFPLTVYLTSGSLSTYWMNLRALINEVRDAFLFLKPGFSKA